ncbi:MAG TPA: NlpC/P60 family protein, partial [Bacillota bacterium]|nr:NlpC/P60 family protein [Bacillota bacterium]
PVVNNQRQLSLITVEIPADAAVSRGYLPYTRANILKQAFKLYGQPYDWGGLHDSVDCSGFIMDIYRCFGLAMPRNSGQQAALPGPELRLESLSTDQRMNQLQQLAPGALLNLPGHVMMYLGETAGSPYIIHALSSYGLPEPTGSQLQKIYHLQVSVTDLMLQRANGQTFLEALTSAKQLELA